MELIKGQVGSVRQSITSEFASLDEFADAVERQAGDWNRQVGSTPQDVPAALDMARNGWADRLDETLVIAESAVELAEREHVVYRVTAPVYDVVGGGVDVGRYLAGDPECMMHYPLSPVSTAGKVVALCSPVTWSGAVSEETIIRRGQVITALALALTRLGHQCELWADRTNTSLNDGRRTRIRVLVKGANDEVDPARILFAFASPKMLRSLCWTYDATFYGVNSGYYNSAIRSLPTDPIEDLPDGTIYLPALRSDYDVPDADTALRGYLNTLGLLAS